MEAVVNQGFLTVSPPKKAIPELLADTQKIVKMFVDTPEGAPISYSQISLTLGYDIRTRRHLLTSAKKIAARDHNCVMETVTGLGYLRARNNHISGNTHQYMTHRIGGVVKRSEKRQQAVDTGRLNPAELNENGFVNALIQAQKQMNRPSAVKKERIKVENGMMPSQTQEGTRDLFARK